MLGLNIFILTSAVSPNLPTTTIFLPTATAAADLQTSDIIEISAHWPVDGL